MLTISSSLLIPLRTIVTEGLLASSGTCAVALSVTDSAAAEARPAPANWNTFLREEIMSAFEIQKHNCPCRQQ